MLTFLFSWRRMYKSNGWAFEMNIDSILKLKKYIHKAEDVAKWQDACLVGTRP
jgi:hypothetical protein